MTSPFTNPGPFTLYRRLRHPRGPSPVDIDPYRADIPSRAQEDPPSDSEPIPLPDESLETGVYISSPNGVFGIPRVIAMASAYGFKGNGGTEDERLIELAETAGSTWTWPEAMEDDDHEYMIELANEAESWLNEHVVPEGKVFAWWEGEFILFDSCDEDPCENPAHEDGWCFCHFMD